MSADQFLTLEGDRRCASSAATRTRSTRCGGPSRPPSISASGFRARSSSICGRVGRCASAPSNGDVGAAGTVEIVDAPRRLAFTWGTDRLTFELTPAGDDGTTFSLTHSFDDRYGAASFATGWELCLAGLRSVLAATRRRHQTAASPATRSWSTSSAWTGRSLTETDGRWTVRVERQLTCPAEVAWDMWFGKDRETGEQRCGARRRRAADAVHGARCRDRHHDRGRPAPRAGVRRGTDRRAGRAPTPRVRRRHRPRRTDHPHRDRHRPGRARRSRPDVGHDAIGHLAASAAEWAAAQPVSGRP